MTPTSTPAESLPFEQPPKLKGRRRILQSLQRMSSSPSLAKLGRMPSSSYNSGSQASMSCVSLSSSRSPYANHFRHSDSSHSSAGFSTAPTSAVSTPGPDSQFSDSSARIRIIGKEVSGHASTAATSVALPADIRPGSKDMKLTATPEVNERQVDYFSKPAVKFKKQRRPKFDFWGEMPNEIKVQIFQFLKPQEIVKCSAVAKSWHKMCYDGQLWKNVDTEEYYQQIPSDSLVKIMTAAGPFVRDLNLRGCVQLREKWGSDGEKISDACRNLENFSLQGCKIDRSSVHYFLLRNPRLVHINVSGLDKVNNHAMKIIAQGCKQLEHLNVSWCPHIDTKGLQKIVRSCPKLKDLRAGEIKGWDDRGFLLDLFQRNSLERLIISNCTDLGDESLILLIQGSEPEIDPLTDRAIVPPRRFRHLDFSRCRTLTDKGVKSLAHNVPQLCGLQLSECDGLTDAGLSGILETTPKLTHLDLEELDDLTNSILQSLAQSPCASNLEHLNISYCESLGDTGMLAVIKACPRLKSLVMDNTRVSDLVLTEAAAAVRARDNLSFRSSTSLTPSGPLIPKVSLNLIVFDCQNVTWTGVREILSRNTEPGRHQIISLKCFYGYQDTVREHMKRVLRGDRLSAERLERKWGEYMVASEEAGAGGAGARRRRRRAREAAMVHADEEEGGPRGGRRRARSGGCIVM